MHTHTHTAGLPHSRRAHGDRWQSIPRYIRWKSEVQHRRTPRNSGAPTVPPKQPPPPSRLTLSRLSCPHPTNTHLPLHFLRLVHLLHVLSTQELIRIIDGPVQGDNGEDSKTRGILGPSLDAAAKLSKVNSPDSFLTQTQNRDAPGKGGDEEGESEKGGDGSPKHEGRSLPAPPVAVAAPAVSPQDSWDPFSDIAESVAGERLLPAC